MKKLLLFAFIAIALTSCSETYKIQLSNGSIVSAIDNENRDYHDTNKVCVKKVITQTYVSEWIIDNNGMMQDSTFRAPKFTIEYKVGTITKY